MINMNGKELNVFEFPNGETGIEFDNGAMIGCYIDFKWESDKDFMSLMYFKCHLPKDVYTVLYIKYLPYSRMDRKIDNYVFTLKYVCEFINNLNFDKVFIYDPHSDVSPALLNNCEIISVTEKLLYKSNITPDYLFYPDAGALKRFHIDGYKSLFANKERDLTTGRIKNYDVYGKIEEGSTIVIIDDLCSYGGTFVKAAEELKRLGAGDVYLIITHCEKSIFNGKIFKTDLIKKVFTTDSIVDIIDSNERLKIFNINKLIGEEDD